MSAGPTGDETTEDPRLEFSWRESEIKTAKSTNSASFDLYFIVKYASDPRFNKNMAEQKKYDSACQEVYNAFVNSNGLCKKIYFCENFKDWGPLDSS